MSLFRGERPALGPITVQSDGLTPAITILNTDQTVASSMGPQTLSLAAQPQFRLSDNELTLGYAGSTTIGSGSASVAAVRGAVTQAAGNTLTGGYQYGVQGKIVSSGTLNNGSGFNAGVFGQVDTSNAAFVHTSGYLAPIMGDFGATSIMSSDANANMISVLNTTNCVINSGLQFIGNATYAFDLSDLAFGGKHFIITAAVGGSQSKKLKVNIDGTAMYIPLNTA